MRNRPISLAGLIDCQRTLIKKKNQGSFDTSKQRIRVACFPKDRSFKIYVNLLNLDPVGDQL